MRDTRERNAAIGGPLAAGGERLPAGKAGCVGGGSASSGKLKVVETKKEKTKRRLIVSDSDSDDYPVYPHRQRAVTGSESVDAKGNCSGAGKLQLEGSVKNGKKVGFSLKRIGQRDVVKYRHAGSINLTSVSLGMQRKRTHEALQMGVDEDGAPSKKIKMESVKCAKGGRQEVNVQRTRLDSVRCGVGKSLIRVSRLPGQTQVAAADEGSESFRKIRIRDHLKGNRSYEAEEINCIEQSKDKMYGLLKQNISSSSTQHYSVSSDGTTLRVQGKGGVLRLLPNNKKFVGHSGSHVEEESNESRNSPGGSYGACKSTLSEGRRFLKKSSSSSVSDESGKTSQFSCGADQRTRQFSLSEGGKSLKKAGYSFAGKEAEKSPGPSNFSDQIIQKSLSFYKDKKYPKKRESPIKEEKRKDPLHSGGAQAMSKRYGAPGDRISIKKPVSSSLEGARKCPGRSGGTAALSEERKILRNPGCSSAQIKSHVGPKGKGLKLKEEPENGKGLKLKEEPENLSPQGGSKKADKLYHRTKFKDKEAGKFISKTLVSFENDVTPGKASRRTEKQKLRDHIKSMLLNAGWTIDMRPRRGRNYEDAVYVSPQGTGYWSITKAYSVLQEQCNRSDDTENDEDKELQGQLFKGSSTSACNHNGTTSQFSAIPSEMLKMLQRNVVQKRRRRIEEDEGDNRRCVSSSKCAKNKKVTVIKKRTTENGIVGSSRKKKKTGRGCTLLVRRSNVEADSEDDGYVPYAGKRSILAWMIDSGTVPANGKVKYMNRRRTRTMLEGLITRDGIHCSCCSKLLSVSKFEIHAGSKLNQPYANIFVEESRASLLQCQLDAWDKQKESERGALHWIDVTDDDPNDDTCAICGDGGDLICCDSCPSTFHLSCLGIQMLPPGDWNCMNCLCRFCGEANSNSVEGDSASGSLLLCEQCEGKYHETCVPETDVAPVASNSSNVSFCGQNCRRLFKHLQNLLGVKNDLDAGFSWTLVQRFDDEPLSSCSNLAQRAECNSKVAVALAVMNECFLPIIDRRSGINLIHNVLYNRGSNFHRLSYSGFYTFILERGDEIISAASIRIRGTGVAEMPFIGTRDRYRRQGMCRRLLNVIEETLRALKIEKLVIPAISELMHTWTVVFGFKPLDDSDRQEIKSMNMLVFPDTGLLQKMLQMQECITTMERGLRPIENDTSMIHNGSDLNTANDGTVSCSVEVRDEIMVRRPASPSSSSYAHEDPELSCQPSNVPFDGPLRTETEALELQSLETAPDGTSSGDHDIAHHDKCCSRSILSAGSPIESEKQFPFNGLSDDAEVQNQDCHAIPPCVPIVDKLSIHASLDVISKSFDTSTFAQTDSVTTLHVVSEDASNFLEAVSEEVHHNSSEVADNPEAARVSSVTALDVHSVEPSLHETDDTLSDTDKGSMGVTTVKADTCALHDDPHPCISEGSVLKVEGSSQVNACKTAASEIIETPSSQRCPLSELPQHSQEFLHDIGLPFSSHSLSRTLQNAYDIHDDGSVNKQTFEMDNETAHAASKHDLSVPCRDKSCNVSANSSNAAHKVDACNHNLHTMQNDIQGVLPSEFRPTCVDSLVDKHGVENGASVLSNHHASIEEYKCCTVGVMKSNGSVPGDRYSF
ncbi:hypothetical protein Taro_038187 [Colocasia esculenta]|uniref:PHD-type domain-containing protein n=1 Tax=Colocasia esculenta TaxID=4460 RepID=A0A843WC22_COLES|nr:hypothetical protein [Colocasia esculenta]